jgi:hypothetical protein
MTLQVFGLLVSHLVQVAFHMRGGQTGGEQGEHGREQGHDRQHDQGGQDVTGRVDRRDVAADRRGDAR